MPWFCNIRRRPDRWFALLAGMVLVAFTSDTAHGSVRDSSTVSAGTTGVPLNRDLSSEYTVRMWVTDDGLPENTVLSITQTPDGYLWLATFNGLVRFDGQRMTEFNPVTTPELASSRIHRLEVDRRGRLWILSEFGDLAVYERGKFQAVKPERPLGNRGVVSLAEDSLGRVWATGGVEEQTGWSSVDGEPGVAPGILRLFVSRDQTVMDESGTMWDTTQLKSERLTGVDKAGARRVEVVPGNPDAMVNGACESKRGGFWVYSTNQAFRLVQGKVVERRATSAHLAGVGAMLEDNEGTLWVGGWSGGLFRFPSTGEGYALNVVSEDPQPPVTSLFVDRENNMWMGLGSRGLRMLRPRTVRMFNLDGFDGTIRSVAEDASGNIWAATLNSIKIIPASGQGTSVIPRENVDLPWVLATDPAGAIWVGTYAGGVKQVTVSSVVGEFAIDPYPKHPYLTTALLYDHVGTTWVGTGRGLFRFSNQKFTPEAIPGDGRQDIRALAAGSQGTIYAALHSRGLWRRDLNGKWKNFSRSDGLPDVDVTSLYADEHGVIWIGTSAGGVACLRDEVIHNFSDLNIGLPKAISCVLEDDHQFFWLGSSRGIYRVARRTLEAAMEGRQVDADVFHYDRADGMNSSECIGGRQPSAIKARDGRLWFPTARGVAMIDPSLLRGNPVPPQVQIEEVWLDDRRLPSKTTLQIPPGGARLEFRFTALSYSAPEKNRFRYKLEGWDTDWIEAGAQRTAHYTCVGPGGYNFRVQASNNEGVWNYEGAALAVAVLPYWWQTYWFRGTAAAILGGCVLLFHLLRVRWLEQARAAQEEFSRRLLNSQEVERKRIAGELHDSLGQNLLIIKNRALLGLQKGGQTGDVANQFHDISAAASRAVREVRDLAHNLRPYQIDELGLSKGIQATVGAMLRAANIEFVHQIERIDGLLSPEFEINLFRIVQESINNIVKHSGATRVEISLHRAPGRISLTIIDNGKGFDSSQSGSSFGISRLVELARIMNGKCEIHSQPGAGTTVLVEMPCKLMPMTAS